MAEKKHPKVQLLQNDFTRKYVKQRRLTSVAARRKRRAVRIIGAFAALALFFCFQLIQARAGLRDVSQQVTTAQTQVDRQTATSKDLAVKIKQLNDKDYLAKLIRAKYYYSKANETIYSLPIDHAADVTAN